jgi:hypothetical protein
MYEETTTEIQSRATTGTFNLDPVLDRVRGLGTKAEALNEAVKGLGKRKAPAVNDLLVKISRILTSTFYSTMTPPTVSHPSRPFRTRQSSRGSTLGATRPAS